MLSEQDANVRWRSLFQGGDVTPETIQQAEQVIEELSPESPLRARLTRELEDIQRLYEKKTP